MNSTAARTGKPLTAALIVLLAVVMILLPGCATPQSPTRLAVVIVIDGMPASHLEKHAQHLSENGFKRLMGKGAWFTDARYSHGATVTASGHATIATGAHPAVHGIVGNGWHEMGASKTTGSVQDSNHAVLGIEDATALTASSPKRLRVATIGDVMKKKSKSAAKISSVSLKDRGAILLAGQEADGAI